MHTIIKILKLNEIKYSNKIAKHQTLKQILLQNSLHLIYHKRYLQKKL